MKAIIKNGDSRKALSHHVKLDRVAVNKLLIELMQDRITGEME